MEQHSFGYWLKLKRKALNLTREELAKQAGYSAATIRKIEDEERSPSAQVVERLAEVFQIPQNERTDFLRFARGDWKSAPVEMETQRPWRASGKSPRSSIPATTTSLIGREKEIALVRDYLAKDDIRLVTLMGPPGIGKTRLSIESARASLPDFPDGVFFVALAVLEDLDSIPSAIIQALGYVERSNDSSKDQLKESIGNKQMLIVLDNCEHLIEAVASTASSLLSACPRLKILATSRESFRISGEWLYLVPAFDIPIESEAINLNNASAFPALMLFVERARAVRPDFKLTADNIQTIAAICAHLDGLPLVIELIAARVRLMTPQTLLERLSAQFVLTADGMRAPSERQKTLQNAIDWSYHLLSEQEQKLFVCLSVFSGSFALAEAEAMFAHIATEKSVTELVALLLDKSLIRRVASDSNEDRYQMLVTIQEYARRHLQELGEETETRNRHLAYFLDLSKNADKELRGPNQLEWINRLETEIDNLRTAMDWAIETGQVEGALQLVRQLHWFWIILSNHTEARQWFQRVLEMSDVPSYPEIHSEVLAQVANHIFLQSGPHDAKPYSEQALTIARAHQDKHNTAHALVMLALALTIEKNFAAAQAALEESQMLFQEVQDEWGYGLSVNISGWSISQQKNWLAAIVPMEEALAIFKKLGDQYFMSVVLRGIGTTQMMQGNLTQGKTAMKDALVLAHKMDSKLEIAWNLLSLGDVAQRVKGWILAVSLYWASRNILDSIGAWQQKDEPWFDDRLAPCRAGLGEDAFVDAVERGRAMTMEQAIAYALEDQE